MKIGILSDTHGVLSEKAVAALSGVDHIIHAGDVGNPDILVRLKQLAPTTAVKGNTDTEEWAGSLLLSDIVELNGNSLFVLHNLDLLDLDPATAGLDMVIFGHTHQPEIKIIDSVLYLNPGSASYRRSGGPLSVATLNMSGGNLTPEIIVLEQ